MRTVRYFFIAIFTIFLFLNAFAQNPFETQKNIFLIDNDSNVSNNLESGLTKSSNSTNGWTSFGLTKVLALANSNNNIIAGTYSDGAYLLKNKETSWIQSNNGLPLRVNLIATSGGNIYASTDQGIYLSTDMCSSWAKVRNVYPNVLTIIDGIIFYGSSSGVYYSSDNCSTWTKCLANVNAWSIVKKGSCFYVCTYGTGVYLSTDNCATWNQVNTGLTDLNVISLISQGDNLIAGTYKGKIFLSSNNGTSWSNVFTGTLNQYIQSLASDGSYIVAGTWSNGAILSIDNGYNWSYINDGLSGASLGVLSLTFKNDSLFAGTSGGVMMRLLSEIKVLQTSLNSLSVPSEYSNNNSFSVISNTNWTVSSDQTWLNPDNASGSGNATITLTAAVNPTNTDRTANITVSGDGVTTQTIIVTQLGKTSGINVDEGISNVIIYPNPSNGKFTLGINNLKGDKIYIKITNLLGVVVREMNICNISHSYNQEVDLCNMANGLYFIEVSINNSREVKSIIISH